MRRVGVILAILVRSALHGLQSGRVHTAIAVVTIGIALFLVGAFAIVVVNMQGLVERFGDDLLITAYLEPGISGEAQLDLLDRVRTVEGVEGARLIDADAALRRFRDQQGGAGLIDGLDENPLPASFEISLYPASRTPEGLAILEASLDGLPGIEEVAHGQDWIEGYARAASFVRLSGYGLGTVLSLATLLIVSNTIRLGVYAREEELDILSLVGASRTYVRAPFLLEGTLQGATGGVLAVALLWLAYAIFVPQLQYGLSFFLGSATPRFFVGCEMLRLVAGGAGLGFFGSLAALFGWRS